MFGISPTKNKMAIVCQSRGSPRPYLYGSRVQNMQRHARIYTGPAGRGLILKYYIPGGHNSVVKILEEYGAFPLNGLNARPGHMTTPPDISGYMKTGSAGIVRNNGVVNGANKSPADSPGSTADRRKSYLSNYTQSSKSSSNITSTSTHQSSSRFIQYFIEETIFFVACVLFAI